MLAIHFGNGVFDICIIIIDNVVGWKEFDNSDEFY